MLSRSEIETNLQHFTGTEHYYRFSPIHGILITDGIKYLADTVGCYWLLDIIASYQLHPDIAKVSFQEWTLLVSDDNTAVICGQDDNLHALAAQRIHYTDFPLAEIHLYMINGVILLPSEN